MKCGHMWERKLTNDGFGWHLMLLLEKLSGYTLAVSEAMPKAYRSSHSAKQLWQSLPPVYRQGAVCYTDFWEAYQQVKP